MSVTLSVVVFPTVEAMTNVPRKHRADRQIRFHFININLVFIQTQGLVWILVAWLDRFITSWIKSIDNLIYDA